MRRDEGDDDTCLAARTYDMKRGFWTLRSGFVSAPYRHFPHPLLYIRETELYLVLATVTMFSTFDFFPPLFWLNFSTFDLYVVLFRI